MVSSQVSDAELITSVRSGDADAYGTLFERHRVAATRMARSLTSNGDADDLVAEAFAKLLPLLRSGGGPDVAFRAYLLTAIRRLHIDRLRSSRRLHTTDNLDAFDTGVPFTDTAVAGFERSAAVRAYASLPERWQLVLWHCEVEGSKPAEVAVLLGMSPNSVAALAYRAREGLRQAYLRSHLADVADSDCRWTTEHLGGYVRVGLSRRDRDKVEQHIERCRRCAATSLELTEINANLRGILAPWLLGAAASGYFASSSASVLAASLPWWTRVAQAVTGGGAPAGAVTAAGVTIGAVVGAALFVPGAADGHDRHQDPVLRSEAPTGVAAVVAPERRDSRHPTRSRGDGNTGNRRGPEHAPQADRRGRDRNDGASWHEGGSPGGTPLGGSTPPGDGGPPPVDGETAPVDVPDTPVNVPDPPVDVPDPPVDVPDPPVDVPDPSIDVPDPPIDVPAPPVDIPRPPVDTPTTPGGGPGHIPGTDPQPEHGHDDEHGHGGGGDEDDDEPDDDR